MKGKWGWRSKTEKRSKSDPNMGLTISVKLVRNSEPKIACETRPDVCPPKWPGLSILTSVSHWLKV